MRFATHDGPGIRTTVFLKGLPLELLVVSQSRELAAGPARGLSARAMRGVRALHGDLPRTRPLARRPGHRHRCWPVPPLRPVRRGLPDGSPREHRLERKRARSHGHHRKRCPLLRPVRRRRHFFRRRAPLPAGFPLGDAEGMRASRDSPRRRHLRLRRCRSALEDGPSSPTSSFTTSRRLDPLKHRANTGVDNTKILSNLRLLSAAGADIMIRIPLIPGFNDDEQDIAAAGEFIAGLPQRHAVHLLPYHRAANGKYRKLGLGYRGEQRRPAFQGAGGRCRPTAGQFRLGSRAWEAKSHERTHSTTSAGKHQRSKPEHFHRTRPARDGILQGNIPESIPHPCCAPSISCICAAKKPYTSARMS